MKQRLSTPRQLEILAEVSRLIKDRSDAEQEIRQRFEQQTLVSQQGFEQEHAELKQSYESDAKDLDTAYVEGLEQARHRFEVDITAVKSECTQQREEADASYHEKRGHAELSWRRTRALTLDNYENDKKSTEEIGEQTRTTLAGYEEQLSWLDQQTQQMLKRRGMRAGNPPPTNLHAGETTADLLKRYSEAAGQTHEYLQQVAAWRATRFLDDGWPLLIFFGTLVASVFPFGMSLGWTTWHWLAASGGLAAAAAILSRQVLHFLVRRKARQPLEQMQASFADARHAVSRARVTVEREHEQRMKRLERKHHQQLEQADTAWQHISSDLDREYRERRTAIDHRQAASEKQLESRWELEARPFKEEYPPRIEQRKQQFQDDDQALRDRRQADLAAIRTVFETDWDAMSQRYLSGMHTAAQEIASMQAFCTEATCNYEDVDWKQWRPQLEVQPAIRFGDYAVDLQTFAGGLATDERLALTQNIWTVPAVLAFPEAPSLLLEATDRGRDEAIRVVRNVMLRLLTSFPPGKVRFTIIDPTGLGQNFSEFMHLADYDERLVTNRIWTEAVHINQRLADLTEHMENVIQKYLRNEFASIQEYNARAGEVAEAFQVLVIANFPANFSEETARRLVSIATSGARCGVYTLIVADMKMSMPRNFDLADLESQANTIVWQEESFRWKEDRLAEYPLSLDAPVQGELLTEIVRAAGEQAKDANRVEVPFAAVVPAVEDWWTHDSRHEVVVPLGRAGATKLQTMRLGKGTSQHVLISGKTGSGKSTLMHAMITNLAIHYSPRELEFFLVDFKKGVEFKTYAEMQLPHARVVAIESEREFGMSVLERLDEELRSRGDRFREAGVQSVAAFRDLKPDLPMPRQLLIVDEFQEFFVKDDKIAQDASLLLDRLVRQGRAFGIHVLLGSQTLAGAYSLARSTLGQMAVRIALQCSEADAHLILSEDNTAARLLSRPGEAIYNNANGLFEGNHPFQVVWLPDSERENYLGELSRLSAVQQVESQPTIVFEGNIAADPADNTALVTALASIPTAHTAASPKCWLGAAVSIKPPTHVTFRRQGGNHLLIVGQKEDLAAGVMVNALIGLAAGQPPRSVEDLTRGARFYVLDGGGFEAEDLGLGSRLSKRLPIDLVSVSPTDIAERMAEIAAEVSARIESGGTGEPIYLAIYNLARFRALRKSEEDYGFSSFSDDDQPANASQNLAHILREGPAVGVHVLTWCDTYNNVTRWFDRATLRDVAHRVLFQMSATDSSNLMDSAAASHLGAIRAIYYNDEQGDFERFRPYGPPTNAWFDQVAELLSRVNMNQPRATES